MAAVVLRLPLHEQAADRNRALDHETRPRRSTPPSRGDGRMLAYASDQSGNVDIWVRRLDGGEERRLTSDQGVRLLPGLFARFRANRIPV